MISPTWKSWGYGASFLRRAFGGFLPTRHEEAAEGPGTLWVSPTFTVRAI
ncbi:hypothetical protein HNQ39_004311 [Armatimonas rosea]|uniref:Uncharacterized protein n=1 Tax=Armatimonas rosea TaxID=685828 RepID=A0A7W9STD4_ARMRO|nr:hypothetical protein [Armatimonas rosea]